MPFIFFGFSYNIFSCENSHDPISALKSDFQFTAEAERFGQASFSAEKAHDPASRRRAPAFSSPGLAHR